MSKEAIIEFLEEMLFEISELVEDAGSELYLHQRQALQALAAQVEDAIADVEG